MPGEWSSMQTSESWRVKKVGWQESCPSWGLSGTRRRGPAHQAAWEAFMVLLVIRHFVTVEVRGRIVLVGDALVLRQIQENQRNCQRGGNASGSVGTRVGGSARLERNEHAC